MHSLSIFGTSSDAGKSTIALFITYLLDKRGIKVAPFKAQNVSNNAKVCDLGGEIAVPQHFCAEAIGLETTHLMNPILLKSGGEGKTHLIINGESIGDKSVLDYYKDIDSLKPIVKEAFLKLKKEYDLIVAEGAGSPVELNLMHKDLSNIYIAKEFKTKIILVADIEKGGVFASVWGVYNLLPEKLRQNVIGVIINKFRGDLRLFDDGVKIIEKEFGLRVLGVIPYKPFNLGFEDSASLLNYHQDTVEKVISIGVISLPFISNFTDFEPLVIDREVEVRFIKTVSEAKEMDMIILPGSKKVISDIEWLKNRGFWEYLKDEKDKPIVAICGGYEMAFEEILDLECIESDKKRVEGLGRFKGRVEFVSKKVVKKGKYSILGIECEGYEIHNGVTKYIWQKQDNFFGTFLHGIFDNDEIRRELFSNISVTYRGYNFKRYKKNKIESYAKFIESYLDMDTIVKELDV